MKLPLISVVVLAYNQEQTIARTLDSILAQKTAYPYEVIIGEDASPTDNTRKVCEEYAERYSDIIRLMPKTSNKGLLKNYRDCLAECRGKYIGCCAGDDWWHNPDKLQMQADFLETNPDYGLVYTDYDVYNTITNRITRSFYKSRKVKRPSGNLYKILFTRNVITAGTVLFCKDVYDKCVDLDSYIEQGFLMEDYPMWLAMSMQVKFKYIDVSTFSYTIAQNSLSISGDDIQRACKFEENVMKVRTYFINKYPNGCFTDKYVLSLFYSFLFNYSILYGQAKLAKKYGWLLFRNSCGIVVLIKLIVCYTPFLFKRLSRFALSRQ